MKTIQNQQKGFTIIEVVLVLAIAGLIFLIVFLAVPALQRSQRDTQRRNDVGRFMSQISAYQSNNNGNVPAATNTAIDDFITRYLTNNGSDTYADPTVGTTYDPIPHNGASAAPSTAFGKLDYYVNAKCNGENVIAGSGTRNIAVITQLEGGARFCQDNS